MTVAELQASIDALKRAKYSGVKRVQYTDRAVEYNSFSEMNQALRDAEAELAALESTPPSSFSLAMHSRD